MDPNGKAQQVWIFIGESDQWHGRPLSLALLDVLKRNGIAGATVLRGIAGYGAHQFVHTALLVELGSNLPVVVTFVDRPDRVTRVMPEVTTMVAEGLITSMTVDVVKSGSRAVGSFPPHLTVADVMSHDVAYVQPWTPMPEIIARLIDRTLRSIPVIDADRRVVGIITDGDLLRRGATTLPLSLQRELSSTERATLTQAYAERPHTAADLMTADPVTLPVSATLAQVAAIMVERSLKRLPVVDLAGKLVGMVSRYDLLATVAAGLRPMPDETPIPGGPASQTVSDIMIRDVPTVQRDTSLAETLDRMVESSRRRVIVIDDQRHVIGIISDGDLLRRATRAERPGALQTLTAWFGGTPRPHSRELDAAGQTAGDLMSSPVIVLAAHAPITEAIRLMMLHKIKRIPVVDADGRLIGLVGRAGALHALAQS